MKTLFGKVGSAAALTAIILGPTAASAQTQVNGFTAANIGNNVGGNTTYNSTTGTYTIVAGGLDIEGTSDHFHYLYKSLSGDGRVTARIVSVTNTAPWTKVGVMVRKDATPNSANAMFLLRPQLGSAGQYRASTSGVTYSTWQENPAPNEDFSQTNPYRTRYLKPSKWLSAVRQGNTVTTYSSDDGQCWNLRTRETISLSGSALIGIALTANHATNKATATVTNLSVTTSVPTDINANCPRAQVDGDLPKPTSWIVSPTSTGWSVTTANPQPNQNLRTCLAGDNPFRRTTGADSPMCPLDQLTHAWAKNGYSTNNSNWQNNKTSRIGNGNGGVTAPVFWLRREVNLTQSQINNLMFWGRWNNSVSIYVNGVLATNTYRSTLAGESHYLGLNDAARAALLPGVNTIGVRVECFHEQSNPSSTQSSLIVNCNNAFSDFGLAQNSALAALPQNITYAAANGTEERIKADIFTQYTKEMGAIGGTFAAYKNGVVVDQRSIGWSDKRLTSSVHPDAIMRLASVDKRVTDAVTVYLYDQGILHPDSKVFGEILNVSPLGGTFGTNVQQITVEQLRTHTSGISNIGGLQGWQDEIAFRFGINASQLTSAHLARVYASYPACEWSSGFNCSILPGQGSQYSSNGHALLRYVAEVAAGKSFNQILTEMGAEDILVSRENSAQRPAKEGGYMIVNKETRARWVELDKYLALSASASGLVQFFLDYAPGYERMPNGTFERRGGGQGGAMDGTRSGVGVDPINGSGEVFIWNSDFGGSPRYDDLRAIRVHGYKRGSCDPRSGTTADRYRMLSVWTTGGDKFLNVEPVNGSSPQLRTSPLGHNGWESAKWHFEPVTYNGQTVYRIRNTWQATQYMQATGTQVDATVITGSMPTGTLQPRGLWRLHHFGDYFRIENVAAPGSFLHVENGNPRIRNYHEGYLSSRWYTCS